MAFITRVYSPANIFVTPADIYFGLTAPTSSLNPTADANTLIIDASGQPTSSTGFHGGLIASPTMPSITEKCNEIHADQFEMAVDIGFDSIEAEFDVIMKETDLSNLQSYLTSNKLGAYTPLANSQVLQMGGQADASSSATSITVIGPNRAAAGKFVYFMLYKSILKLAIQMTFTRKKEVEYKLKFGGFMDLTRVDGDTLMQIAITK